MSGSRRDAGPGHDAAVRLEHVAVIVRDLDAGAAVPVAGLGLAVRQRTTVREEDATVAFVSIGRAELELVQPLSRTGALAKFLETRGEALHHLALRVPDIEAAIARAASAGLRPAGRAPRAGARGSRVAFFHPSSLHGVLVELVEER